MFIYWFSADSLQSCLLWLVEKEGTSSLNTFIRRWRWELQEDGTSQDLEPEDQQLAEDLIDALKSLEIHC